MVQICMHSSLVRFTNNEKQIEMAIETAADILPALCQAYPSLQTSLLDAQGELTPYVNVYINGTNLNQCLPHAQLKEQDKIDFVTALVGG